MRLPWYIKVNKDIQVRDGKLVFSVTVRKIYIVYLYIICTFSALKSISIKFNNLWNK